MAEYELDSGRYHEFKRLLAIGKILLDGVQRHPMALDVWLFKVEVWLRYMAPYFRTVDTTHKLVDEARAAGASSDEMQRLIDWLTELDRLYFIPDVSGKTRLYIWVLFGGSYVKKDDELVDTGDSVKSLYLGVDLTEYTPDIVDDVYLVLESAMCVPEHNPHRQGFLEYEIGLHSISDTLDILYVADAPPTGRSYQNSRTQVKILGDMQHLTDEISKQIMESLRFN